MKNYFTTILMLLATVPTFAQDTAITPPASNSVESTMHVSIVELLLPILFISFLVLMLITLVKYFLEFRLKSKLIDRGMAEQLATYISSKNGPQKQHEAIKFAILFCGIGIGLIATYLTAPIHIHSLAIMAFSVGLSYLAYYFYLRK